MSASSLCSKIEVMPAQCIFIAMQKCNWAPKQHLCSKSGYFTIQQPECVPQPIKVYNYIL